MSICCSHLNYLLKGASMPSLHFLCQLDELPQEEPTRAQTSKGEPICLVRIGELVFAYGDLCPHKGGPMSEGEIENGALRCPWHGWRFEILTGDCINVPDACLTPYTTIVQEGKVFLQED